VNRTQTKCVQDPAAVERTVRFVDRGTRIVKEAQPAKAVVIRSSLFALLASVAAAQTGGGYELTWSVIASGGETLSAASGYELGGTIGQANAGALAGGDYSVQGGFWSGAGCGSCVLYADVADPRCVVEITDLLFILAAYAAPDPCLTHPTADIFPCGQPCSIVELADVTAVLDAYAGILACVHPCAP